jgi:hypothetical protein
MKRYTKHIFHITATIILCLSFSHAAAFEVNTTSYGLEIKWSIPQATYYINTSGGPSGSLSALQASMQTWTDVASSTFYFLYGGTTGSSAYGINDGVNILCFGLMDIGTLAENSFWYSTSTGQILDSDIEINTHYIWSTTGAAGVYDLQNIGTHELGHSLSLGDLYSPSDSEVTMYGYASAGETKKRTLSQDDIDGIAYLYPSQTSLPVYRFWSDLYLGHFYTISEADRNYIMATWPDVWQYEGIVWYANTTQVPGTLPVYRFWSDLYLGHFYTISEADRDYIMATWPDVWQYEGIAWYANTTQVPGTLPVYRFWSDLYLGHFYTISEADRDYIMATWPDVWQYEGIAYYAYPQP